MFEFMLYIVFFKFVVEVNFGLVYFIVNLVIKLFIEIVFDVKLVV